MDTFVIMCFFEYPDPSGWTELDVKVGKLASIVGQVQLTIGFSSREKMLHFAGTVLPKMPTISRVATVHYMICDYYEQWGWWYQASLESDELTGGLSAL